MYNVQHETKNYVMGKETGEGDLQWREKTVEVVQMLESEDKDFKCNK